MLPLKSGEMLSIFLVFNYIMKLVRVFLQVVKLVIRIGFLGVVEMQKLVSAVAHAIMTHDIMLSRTIIIMVIEILSPILGCSAIF